MSSHHGQLQRNASRSPSASRIQANAIKGLCVKCLRAPADGPASPAASLRTASPHSPSRGSGSKQMVEVSMDVIQVMQVQISSLTSRVTQLEELLAELSPRTVTPRSSSASLLRNGSSLFFPTYPHGAGEVGQQRVASQASSTQARNYAAPLNQSGEGPLCPQIARPLTWLRLPGSSMPQVNAGAMSTPRTSSVQTPRKMESVVAHHSSPLDNSIPLLSHPAICVGAEGPQQLSALPCMLSAGSKPPSLSNFVTTTKMVRTRSVDTCRIARPLLAQNALPNSSSAADLGAVDSGNTRTTDLGQQLQRARQSAVDQSPERSPRQSAVDGSPERSSSESPAKVPSLPTGTLQIVHVSTQEDSPRTSREDSLSPRLSPRRRRPATKAQPKENDSSKAPHVVLSLHSEKRTFLKKGSGSGIGPRRMPQQNR